MIILPRKKATLFIKLSMLGAISALSLQANASDAVGPGDSDSKWVLGASVDAFNNPYSGEGSEAWLSPNLRYNGERFFINNGSLNLHIAKSNDFSAGLKVALDSSFLSDRDDYKGNKKLAGLTERKETVLGGIYVNHDTDLGRLSFSALTDLGNEHDGQIAGLKYIFDLNAGNWNINPELGVEWLSADYVDHHVGVSRSEATNSRSVYQGKDTVNAFVGIRARYQVTENWDINVRTGVSKLGSGIEESPIIDDDMLYQASFGVNYNF